MNRSKPPFGAGTMQDGKNGNRDVLDLLGSILTHISGKKLSDCCIIIPSGHSVEMIEAHLSALSKQEPIVFDVLIIGNAPSKKYDRLNLLAYSEKYPLGEAGAFGLGQVLAYELGYEYIINADIDCLPVSKNLVMHLKKTAEQTKKAVFPISVFDRNCDLKTTNKNYIVNHYGTFPREAYGKFGFTNFRFLKGGEDAELHDRFEMEKAVAHDEEVFVEHKNLESNYIDAMLLISNKYIYYSKNFIIANILLSGYALKTGRLMTAIRDYVVTIYSLLLYWIIFNNYHDFLVPIFRDGLTLKMDCVYAPRTSRLKKLPKKEDDVADCLSIEGENEGGLQFKPKTWLLQTNRLRGMLYLITMCVKIILKRAKYLKMTARFMNEYKFFIQYLILLKPLEYRDGKIYSQEMGPIRLGINLVIFAIALPIIIPIVAIDVLVAAVQNKHPIKEKNLKWNIMAFRKQISNGT